MAIDYHWSDLPGVDEQCADPGGNYHVFPGGTVSADHAAGGIQRFPPGDAGTEHTGILGSAELKDTRKVLTAAAMTYVASAASMILQLLRLIILFGGRSRDDN